MTRASANKPVYWSVEEVQKRIGNVPPSRIRLDVPPGRATEADLVRINDRKERGLCELVDGVLVEKPMGTPESQVGSVLNRLVGNHVEEHNLGVTLGPDSLLRLLPGVVRGPDTSFVPTAKLPNGVMPPDPIADLVPDLAVEVLSKSNSKEEMAIKLREYFLADVRLVWFVDPVRRTVQIFTAPGQSRILAESDTLDGGDVLPGFSLPVARLFARLAPPLPPSPKPKKRK